MSGNGAVWGRVRSRLRAFPERLAACGAEAAAYGRCVQASMAPGGRLRKDLCAQEFQALRSCFAAAAKKTLNRGHQERCPPQLTSICSWRAPGQAPGADGPKVQTS
ncbi:NADH dehydrogenase [ubiquinone] 1 alpha subcomplex assembly factor 8 [Pteropus medius]|uniref:NADH dehydrogenase [ubiquinone] 1 alpha subcomplex assembly factor 8 n=1 Tax=Pteropus vampyrus TaxID=132908 RepID=A0A6P3R669_PTEVA|nr:NADH dehydrogenase [ubiquinone] 1 alpha subcomplex assembly factor 8 [Pteropus vampyrus]XP_039715521.1 NADH dehydrogenase [ubiquinone] 1 alpha subcomplex assembly factor 8 [Pteropus giganteus]